MMGAIALPAAMAAAVCVAVAVGLMVAPSPDSRAITLMGSPPRKAAQGSSVTRLAVVAAAAGALLAIPFPWGLMVAAAAVGFIPRWLRRLQARESVKSDEALARQAPVIADLLAATVASGAPITQALHGVAYALGEPASARLTSVELAINLGADPPDAWAAMREVDALAPIAEAAMRSMRTGAPLAAVLGRLADDLRRERQAQVEVAARAAGVRAVAPLAACFLPAFLLVGVVPVVASLASGMLG